MSDAWLEYDPQTGMILGVSWEDPGRSSMMIPHEMAERLMTGHLSILSHRVEVEDGCPSLVESVFIPPPPVFWDLSTIDGGNMPITISPDGDLILIKHPREKHPAAFLYATIMEDPSWLIDKWDLRHHVSNDGVIAISLPNARNYSFYLGVVHEV